MPIFRRPRRVLLHVVCCAVTSGEKVDISCNAFFVGYCVVNLDGTSCVYANVVWKWVCRGVGLVSASCDTPICTRHSHIHMRSHLGLLHNTPQKRHYS